MWGNTGWSADLEFLTAVISRCTNYPRLTILECGSGLTTVLLSVVAKHCRHTLISLENDSEWMVEIGQRLKKLKAIETRPTGTMVFHAPLISYGEFDWYDISAACLDGMHIDVVVCVYSSQGGPRFQMMRDRAST